MIEQNILLAPKTSYRIGGNADYFCTPKSYDDIAEALDYAQRNSLDTFVLGRGSNILISDKGYRGLIIDMSELNTITFNNSCVTAQAGALFTKFILTCVQQGLGGLEELAGIPGTVGGGILMNAGAYEQTISDCLSSVTWLDQENNQIHTSPIEELEFGYRTSTFRQKRAIVLAGEWALHPASSTDLKERVSTIQAKRKKSQPLQYPSCGSVFKRPPGNYAGALIQEAGLKGYTIGGAQISEKHANFIINTGGATAQDVHSLISHARQEVYKKSGILLENEVIFVGDFPTPLWTPNQ